MKLKYIVINIGITSFLLFFAVWILPLILAKIISEKMAAYIAGTFLLPGYFIILLFKRVSEGAWGGMHNVSFRTYFIVSFVFYSAVIALIQVIVYKRRKKRQERLGKS